MNPLMIAQLLIAIGPAALDLIPKLAALWNGPALTEQQIIDLCVPAKKSYDDYIANAKAILNP